MTDKEKLKSIKRKMKRIEDRVPDINEMMRHFSDIDLYSKLWREHFHLKWEMDHCKTCGKKL